MADIVLRDHDGEPITYTGIETVTFDAPGSGDRVVYTHGVEQKDFEVGLNLKDGDQTVKAADGYLLKELTIKKPESLRPENVRWPETVAGVKGEFIGDTEEIIIGESDGAIPLDFTGENQEVVPSEEGKVISKVIIEVPTNLRPEIIAEGEVIGGVEGTHKGGDYFITYMSADGTETLYVKPVMYGDTCGDIIDLDFIETPTKENTETEEYTFAGWAASIGGEADDSLLTSVAEDKTVYAAFVTVPIIASGTFASGAAWKLNGSGVFTVSGEGAMDDYASQNDQPWLNNINDIQSLVVMDGITSIGARNFTYATALESVIIPGGVTSIGRSAFNGCTALENVNIPGSVTFIDTMAFRGCTSLASIGIPISVTSIGDYALDGCGTTGGFSIYYEGNLAQWLQVSRGSSWSSSADWYINGEKLVAAIIPDGVTEIPARAFQYCASLQSVTIPDSVTSIGNSIFSQCPALTSATIGNGVTSITNSMFGWCSELTEIVIPDSVTSIADSAFNNCTALASVTIGSGVTSIGLSAFLACKALTSIVIPNAVTDIGQQAFSMCSSLQSVTIGSGVTHIGVIAFANCTNLTSATFRDTTTWYVTQTAGATSGTTLNSSNLSNTSTAATYLKTTYQQYHWYKK